MRQSTNDTTIFSLLKQQPLGSTSALHASSNSMWPLIVENDFVTAQRIEFSAIRRNEIIVFFSPTRKQIIIHRAFSKKGAGKKTTWVTKGDNNFSLDAETVSQKFFLGRVILIRKQNTSVSLIRFTYGILQERKTLWGKICRKLFFYFFD